MRGILLVGLLLCNLTEAISQSYNWTRSWSWENQNNVTGVGVDKLQNIYTTVSTWNSVGGSGVFGDQLFMKLDPMGNVQWIDSLNFSPTGLVTDSLGMTYIVAGDNIKKFDSNGNLLATYLVPFPASIDDIALNPKGGFVIEGKVLNPGAIESFISYYDSNDQHVWTKTGELPWGGSLLVPVTCDSDGNSYVAAGGYPDSTSSNKGFLAKYDLSGNQLYILNIPHTANDVITDKGNNVFVCGHFSAHYSPIFINRTTIPASTSEDQSPVYLIKYSPSGIVLWYKIFYGGTGWGALATDGTNLLVTIPATTLQMDSYLLSGKAHLVNFKFDSAGTVVWMDTTICTTTSGSIYQGATRLVADKLVIAGVFSGNHTLGSYSLTQVEGNNNPFVAKLDITDNTIITEILPVLDYINELSVFPNPSTGWKFHFLSPQKIANFRPLF